MSRGVPRRGALRFAVAAMFSIFLSLAFTNAHGAADLARLHTVPFSDLAGWADDDHQAALRVFVSSCRKLAASAGAARKTWTGVCMQAQQLHDTGSAQAKAFFETEFAAYRVEPTQQAGFLTGYYEPEVAGSLSASSDFPVPLYARPEDLVAPLNKQQRALLGGKLVAARQVDGKLHPYLTRSEIEQGGLAGKGLELVWLRDAVTAFFIHIQGSTRVRLADGSTLRVAYAGKNGHPYTSIGKVVAQEYDIAPADLTADRLRKWLQSNEELATEILWRNESFVFFRLLEGHDPNLGPVGALGVPLTPMRSLAVDRKLYSLGIPVWIDARLPASSGRGTMPVRRLMIAQDTGAAIVGPARGDVFFGSGEQAGLEAGRVRHQATFTLLLPRTLPLPAWAAGPKE